MKGLQQKSNPSLSIKAGNLKVVNLNAMRKKWKHLCDTSFTNIRPKPPTDIFNGVNYAALHCAQVNIRREP